MFGKSQSIPLAEAKAQIESLVCSRSRDYILAFHGDHSDRKALANLNIELRPLYIIDNVNAAQYPLGLTYRLGLEAMLDTFDIPYADLHTAGNDAHYALRCMLMIAVADGRKMGLEPAKQALLSTLVAIARKARPSTVGEKAAFEESRRQANAEKAARHKAKRAARTERRKQEREARIQLDNEYSSAEDNTILDKT
ncbi:hypothetical protein F5Y01DRAFT_324710 [Xylaria sp. FL0043]|nr:hypothetical protein F5Y01DRAFT_324710 [Xylaria sp. FL0043]